MIDKEVIVIVMLVAGDKLVEREFKERRDKLVERNFKERRDHGNTKGHHRNKGTKWRGKWDSIPTSCH